MHVSYFIGDIMSRAMHADVPFGRNETLRLLSPGLTGFQRELDNTSGNKMLRH